MSTVVNSAAGGNVHALRPAGLPGGEYVELDNGIRAFVRTAGTSRGQPPVLLLHGLGATGALNWGTVMGPLAERGQVIAIDQRGHGRGPRVGNRFRLADCADDAAAVLRALGARPAVVIGYSMGGPIAQLVAHRHPDLVEGLILCATARDFRGRPADRIRFGIVGALAAAAVAPTWPPPPVVPVLPGRLRPVGWALSEFRRHEPAALLSAAAALGRFTSRDWVSEIDKPVAVIVHKRDRLVPTHRQQRLAAAIPGATSLEVDLDHTGIGSHPDTYLSALVHAQDSLRRRSSRLAA